MPFRRFDERNYLNRIPDHKRRSPLLTAPDIRATNRPVQGVFNKKKVVLDPIKTRFWGISATEKDIKAFEANKTK